MVWFNEFDKIFRRLSDRFFDDDIFEMPVEGNQVQTFGPYYYGYQMTVGEDGKPRVREWGNVRPSTSLSLGEVREPYVDEIINKETNSIKLVAEMPGIDKKDINVTISDNIVHIHAEHGDRKYKASAPLRYKVDENSAKASYSNGILELELKLAQELPTGKPIPVE